MKRALEICAANADSAKARRDSERVVLRARFPYCVSIVAELTAAGFKPRVMAMAENGNEWRRA